MSGCGGGQGVADGATVSVYAVAPLCAEARRESARNYDRAGELRVRVLCLQSERRGKRLDLATAGANARRTAEDSTSVAYLTVPNGAARFSAPILESAEIAQLQTNSGRRAMATVLAILRRADSSTNPRKSIFEELR